MSGVANCLSAPSIVILEQTKKMGEKKKTILKGTLYVTNDNSITQGILTTTSAPEFLIFLP